MAVEPVTNDTASEDFPAHTRDYSKFVKILKYSAIASFLIAMFVVFLIS